MLGVGDVQHAAPRAASGSPRRSAMPYSVTKTPASQRGVLTGPDSVATMRLCAPAVAGKRDDRHAAAAAVRAAHEVDRAADRADITTGRHFGVDLAAEVDLDRRVDGDEAWQRGQHIRVVGVVGAAHLQRRVAVRVAVQARCCPSARRRCVAPGSRPLWALVTTPASISAMTPSPTAPECTPRSRRSCSAASTASGMAPRPHCSVARSSIRLAAWAAMAVSTGPDAGPREHSGAYELPRGIDARGVQMLQAHRPRRLVVHFRDHDPRRGQRGQQVFVRQAQAVPSLRVGRRHLKHQHVDAQRAAADARRQLGIVAGPDVEQARLGKPPVGPAAAVAEEVDRVRMPGLHRPTGPRPGRRGCARNDGAARPARAPASPARHRPGPTAPCRRAGSSAPGRVARRQQRCGWVRALRLRPGPS